MGPIPVCRLPCQIRASPAFTGAKRISRQLSVFKTLRRFRSHPRLVPMNTQSGILCDLASLVLYGRCQASSRPHARFRKGESRRTLSECQRKVKMSSGVVLHRVQPSRLRFCALNGGLDGTRPRCGGIPMMRGMAGLLCAVSVA